MALTNVLLTGIHVFNHLNAELNPIRHLLALEGAHHIVHVSGVRVNKYFLVILFIPLACLHNYKICPFL